MGADDSKSSEEEWTYKGWYEANKDSLSDRRKNRYHNDPEYKKKVLKQNKEYRKKKLEEKAKKPKANARIPKHRKPVTMKIRIHGSLVESQLVHVGAFAKSIGRSVPTVHQWERIGLLPRTPYLLCGETKQERLYTDEMISVVREVLGRRGTFVSSSDPTFRSEIISGWESIGADMNGGDDE